MNNQDIVPFPFPCAFVVAAAGSCRGLAVVFAQQSVVFIQGSRPVLWGLTLASEHSWSCLVTVSALVPVNACEWRQRLK